MAEIYRHQQAQEIGSVGSVVLMETLSDALPKLNVGDAKLFAEVALDENNLIGAIKWLRYVLCLTNYETILISTFI